MFDKNNVVKHKNEFDDYYQSHHEGTEEAETAEEALEAGLRLKRNPILTKNYYSKFCSRIYKNLKVKRGDKVLDAGCGTGIDVQKLSLAYPNADFFGFDISEVMIKQAKKYASDGQVFLAIGEMLPIKDSAFSKVYSREVIEHVISPQRYIDELARVTQQGGIIIIATPNGNGLYGRFIPKILKKVRGYSQTESLKDEALTYGELKDILANAKLSIEKVIFDGFLYFMLSSTWSACPRLITIITKAIVPLSTCFEKIPGFNRLFCDQMVVVAKKS